MGLTAGIVGLPNVGKSTLFNAITKKNILAANYPFATIEPNVGIVTVPDSRLDYLAEKESPERVIGASYEFIDIAGLVKGASKGEGLGNKFLSHIREVDAICEVVRCFKDPNITHVEGDIDPIRDIEIIDLELIISDLEIIQSISNPKYLNYVNFTVSVKNNGVDVAKGVIVNASVPEGLSYVSGASDNYNPLSGLWNVGDVASGDEYCLNISLLLLTLSRLLTFFIGLINIYLLSYLNKNNSKI